MPRHDAPAPDRPTPKRGITPQQWIILGLAALLIAVGIWQAIPSQPGRTATEPGLTGPTPPPWTYDAANNRHWDPGHGHWHDGPPPAGIPTPAPGSPAPGTPGMAGPPGPLGAPGAPNTSIPPLLAAPQTPGSGVSGGGASGGGGGGAGAWAYDAENDRHWDPNHGHWHPGPPPGQESLPPLVIPERDE